MSDMSTKKSIDVGEVNRKNSNLYQYDLRLVKALRQERFKPADPEAYNAHCRATGIQGFSEPFANVERDLDLETFISTLPYRDANIIRGTLLGMTQTETAARVGLCQAWVSHKLRSLAADFKEFYEQE